MSKVDINLINGTVLGTSSFAQLIQLLQHC